MWQHIVVFTLVALAILYLGRVLRRATSGKTACAQGLCDGCAAFAGCQDRHPETCVLREEQTDQVTADSDPHGP
jgi:hypothetical protein